MINMLKPRSFDKQLHRPYCSDSQQTSFQLRQQQSIQRFYEHFRLTESTQHL